MNGQLIGMLVLSLTWAGAATVWGEDAKSDEPVLSGPKADRDQGRRRSADGGKGFGGRHRGERPGDRILAALNTIGATDEQKQKVREILAEQVAKHKKFKADNAEALKAIREKMAAAKRDDDKEAMKAAREELLALRKAAGLPAGEQRKKAKQFRKDNADKIKAIHKKIVAAKRSGDTDAEAAARQELRDLWKTSGIDGGDVMQQIRAVLTPEQIKVLSQMRLDRMSERAAKRRAKRGHRDGERGKLREGRRDRAGEGKEEGEPSQSD